jgi:hypothetical protein
MPIADFVKYKERPRNLAVDITSAGAIRSDVDLALAKGKHRKGAHRIAMFFCYPSLPIWIAAIGLFLHYDATRPNHPVPSAGRIYGQNNHGHVVYLTRDEESLVSRLTFLPFCLFFVGFTLDRLFGEPPQPLKSKVPWENRQW